MTRAARPPEAGVTLVEMLVALALFALVGLGAFAMLDAVIRARQGTEGRLEAAAALDLALALIDRDLAQSDAGSQRIDGGTLSFGLAAAGVRVAMGYDVADGALTRRAGALAQPLVTGVEGVAWRALDRSGAWHDAWPPEGGGSEAPALAGVEMRLTLAGGEAGEPPTVAALVSVPLL